MTEWPGQQRTTLPYEPPPDEAHVYGDFRVLALQEWGYLPGEPIPCVACSRMGNWILHHVLFRSRGGGDAVRNLVPLCNDDHDRLHDERIRLEWIEGPAIGVIGNWGESKNQLLSWTPWPPSKERYFYAAQLLRTAQDSISDAMPVIDLLTAPQLSDLAAEVIDLTSASARALCKVAYMRLMRTPLGRRQAAAEAIAVEWSERGRKTSAATIWGQASEWDKLQDIAPQTFEDTPVAVRRYAAQHAETKEEAKDIVDEWHDRPDGQSFRAWKSQRTEPDRSQTCEACGGRGTILCTSCGGTGLKGDGHASIQA